MTDYRTTGTETFARMMGQPAAERLSASADSGAYLSGLSQLALDFAFGAVWGRPGLEPRQRSLVVIGILISSRQYAELRNHVRIAIANGLTPGEIEEAVIQCIPYAGFPAVASAIGPVVETLRELGLDPGIRTPAERGAL